MKQRVGINYLYSAADSQKLDKIAIEDYQETGLMEKAGELAFACLGQFWPSAKAILVLCGTGNNGGDGFVLARHAHNAGLKVTLVVLGDTQRIKGDALTAYVKVHDLIKPIEDDSWKQEKFDVIIDAMLGTGVKGELSARYAQTITWVNEQLSDVLAIDIPTGLNPDTGETAAQVIKAEHTVTFIAFKQGCFLREGPRYCGQLHFSDLGIPEQVYLQVPPAYTILQERDYDKAIEARPLYAHKGNFGHVLVVGSDADYSGAARLSAMTALRAGAGMVTVATHPKHAAVMNAVMPELMVHAIEDAEALSPLLAKASVIVFGPGLSDSAWSKMVYTAVMKQKAVPMVVDAGALRLLSEEPVKRDNWILTPHPGEAAGLLNQETAQVQADRKTSVDALSERFGGVAVLKGQNTLVQARSQPVSICLAGNPGMATAGMGDVLAGLIAALIAQGANLPQAAGLGVLLHATAGDEVAVQGKIGMIATDLIPVIKKLINQV